MPTLTIFPPARRWLGALTIAVLCPWSPVAGAQDGAAMLPEAPAHPMVEASDADWNQWHAKNAAWLEGVRYQTRNALLAKDGNLLTNKSVKYDWRLESRFRGLTLSEIQKLAVGGVIETGQSYALGNKPDKPLNGVFVTSDMMLHAYNMMVADFVRGMEMQRAPKLRRSLEAMWPRIKEWPLRHNVPRDQVQSAVGHAQRVIGTALLCLESSVDFKDVTIEQDCRAQLDLIRSSSVAELPPWLGPPDGDLVSIDYQRMKPVGFYPENETLTGLFRAIRWLQVVPFRPNRDDELIAFAILAEAAESSGIGNDDQMQREWLGLPNSLTVAGQTWLSESVAAALRAGKSAPDFTEVRTQLSQKNYLVHANDDVRLDPKLAGQSFPVPLLKIIPAYLTADSLLFLEVLSSNVLSDWPRLPEGRMITAYLGDTRAIEELRQNSWSNEVLAIVQKASSRRTDAWSEAGSHESIQSPYSDRETFNSLFMHTLAALFLPPTKEAPAFMTSAAWLGKSRNCVLAAWAEKKHSWVLHEVEPTSYLMGSGPPPPPPGMVEPNPEFFHRLAALAEKNIQWMERNGYLGSDKLNEETQHRAAEYLRVARSIRELKLDTVGNLQGGRNRDDFVNKYFDDGVIPCFFPTEKEWLRMTAVDFEKLRDFAANSAELLLNDLDADSSREELLHPPRYRRGRWALFLGSVRQLEKMAVKELRVEEWDTEEREYLTQGVWMDYYSIVYRGDNWQVPDPESMGPKIAPVASDPNSKLIVHAGTGEMSEIYVLYPWKGTSYLYRGPVVPYYELTSKTRMDDKEWRMLLKSQKQSQPDWLAPFIE